MVESRGWGTWLFEWAALTLGVLVAILLVPGIYYDAEPALRLPGIEVAIPRALALAVLVLSVLNAVVRPLLNYFLLLLAAPLIVLTLGLAALAVLWVVNALLLYGAGQIVTGFHVANLSDAMLGALVISVVSWLLNALTGDAGAANRERRRRGGREQ
ncbi:MAG: phage holin family protein [Puniceicoccales bacterium]|jgi:putative membrane protein|nr:phage holin family protein [Puniceicoccales bacterium]